MDTPEERDEFVAIQLSGIFYELRDQISPSQITGVDLCGADAFGCAERLIILRSETKKGLTLWPQYVRFWLIDSEGFRRIDHFSEVKKWLVKYEQIGENPWIKFATIAGHLRIGMRFGKRWYKDRDGELSPENVILSETLTKVPIPAEDAFRDYE